MPYPHNLGKGKIYSILNNKCLIYDNKYFNKLFELEFEDKNEIKSLIELDNNDLVIIGFDYEFLIYRLKDKKYSLFQRIKEDIKGFKTQTSYIGYISYSKTYEVKWMKKLSSNRFMSISNYGIKIYSLNENNQYSLILMNTHLEGIEKIYEINEKELIFCTNKYYPSSIMEGIAHNYLLIEKIKLNNIKQKELNEKEED